MAETPPPSARSAAWLRRFALLTAAATLGLIAIGGLVTSKGVGMAVPDWPTSYGYNMFALPVSAWFTGGVFHEHTHRLWASVVGVLVVTLTRWLAGNRSRLPLAMIGGAEIVAGLLLPRLGADWRGAGHFLSGIGGVVLLAGIVWVKNAAAARPLPALGWWAFALVQLQGLLGGLRVVLDAQELAGAKLGVVFGLIHGCLGQAFLLLLCVIALFATRWWRGLDAQPASAGRSGQAHALRPLLLGAAVLVFGQLILGATMRHQHAGLAVPDFPLAHGKLWPATDAASVAGYNTARKDALDPNPITAMHIHVHMAHRIGAFVLLGAAVLLFVKTRRTLLARFGAFWLGLILVQASLGASVVWTNKAADLATLHVVCGALALVSMSLAAVYAWRVAEQGTVDAAARIPADSLPSRVAGAA